MAYRYQGNSNDGLVSALEEDKLLVDGRIKKALLEVPRGEFVPIDYLAEAFQDKPLRLGQPYSFNVSAPHMYAFCLEHLEIQPGNSFLDIGSGCGHMTALGGYLVGKTGESHGVDISPHAIELAKTSLRNMKRRGIEISNVTFEKRNIFLPDKDGKKWDRIHVGAACAHKLKFKIYELLKPGGILIMPIGSSMVLAKKDIYGLTKETKLIDVRYGELVTPTDEEIEEAERIQSMQVVLPEPTIISDYVKMHNSSFLSDVIFRGFKFLF